MINQTLPLFETPNIEIYEFDKMTDKTDLIPSRFHENITAKIGL